MCVCVCLWQAFENNAIRTKGLFVFIGPAFSKTSLKLIMRIKEIGHTDWKQNGRQNGMRLKNVCVPLQLKILWSNVNNTDGIHRNSQQLKIHGFCELYK